jgi:neutral trehalase
VIKLFLGRFNTSFPTPDRDPRADQNINTSLVYRMSSRTARATQRNPVSKNQKIINQTKKKNKKQKTKPKKHKDQLSPT